MAHSRRLILASLLLVGLCLCGCTRPERPVTTFVTEYGLGPDKWASAWLLTRHVEPEARLIVVSPGEALPSGTWFDVPRAPYRRRGELSTFEVLRQGFALEDPTLAQLGRVVQDIEVYFWMEPGTPEAPGIEHAFRNLQLRHARDAVPVECYLAFFDRVYGSLAEQQRGEASRLGAEALELECQKVHSAAAGSPLMVPELPLQHLLDELSRGKRVVFVDVREPEEFAESHIPGALNIPLRSAASADIEQLKLADHVISYCVKDFRGFEMAKELRRRGVRGSAILNPFGLQGWVSSGLPVAGPRGLSEAEAAQSLAECAKPGSPCRSGMLATGGQQ